MDEKQIRDDEMTGVETPTLDVHGLLALAAFDLPLALKCLAENTAEARREGLLPHDEWTDLLIDRLKAELYCADGGYLSAARAVPLLKALLEQSDNSTLRLRLALSLLRTGRRAEGLQEVQHVLDANPNHPDAHSIRAMLLLAEHDEISEATRQEALSDIDTACRLMPEDPSFAVFRNCFESGRTFREVMCHAFTLAPEALERAGAKKIASILRRYITIECMILDEEKLEIVKKALGVADFFTDPEDDAWRAADVTLAGQSLRLRFPLNLAGISKLPPLWLERVRRQLVKYIKTLSDAERDALKGFEIHPTRRVWAIFAEEGATERQRIEVEACRFFIPLLSLERMKALLAIEMPEEGDTVAAMRARRRFRAMLSGRSQTKFADLSSGENGTTLDESLDEDGLDMAAIESGMRGFLALVAANGMRGALSKLDQLPAAFRELTVYEFEHVVLNANEVELTDIDKIDHLTLLLTVLCGIFVNEPEWALASGVLFAKADRFGPAYQCALNACRNESYDIDALSLLLYLRETLSSPDFRQTFRERVDIVWRRFEEKEAEIREMLEDGRLGDASEKIKAAISLINTNWSFQLTADTNERWGLIFSPEGDRLLLFVMLEFIRRMPERLKTHWRITVGREAMPLPYSVTLNETTLSIEKMLVYPKRSPEGYDFEVYSPEFPLLTADEKMSLPLVLKVLAALAVGDAVLERWVNRIEPLESKPDGENQAAGIPITELADYFHEAEPLSKGFGYENLIEEKLTYWHKPIRPARGFYDDVGTGETQCPVFVEERREGSTLNFNRLEYSGAAAGFFYASKVEMSEESLEKTPPSRALLEKLREHVLSAVGCDAVRFVGEGHGEHFDYLEFFAWDFAAIRRAAADFFRKDKEASIDQEALGDTVDMAGMSAFRRDAETIVFRGDDPFSETAAEVLQHVEDSLGTNTEKPSEAEADAPEGFFMMEAQA